MAKVLDFSGFWEFPKVSKVYPICVQNSQELGKFPESSNAGFCPAPFLRLELGLKFGVGTSILPADTNAPTAGTN